MRDLRVDVWTAVTVNADGTTYGPTIDLLDDYVGDHLYGTGEYGIGVWLMGKDVVTGTGDGFTVTWKWQHSEDGSSWDDAGEIGVMTIDTDGNFTIGARTSTLTRDILKSRKGTARGYLRLAATAAGITGGESIGLTGWLGDGTNGQYDDGVHY